MAEQFLRQPTYQALAPPLLLPDLGSGLAPYATSGPDMGLGPGSSLSCVSTAHPSSSAAYFSTAQHMLGSTSLEGGGCYPSASTGLRAPGFARHRRSQYQTSHQGQDVGYFSSGHRS
eukprot:3292535-Rhodomonas_salina.2